MRPETLIVGNKACVKQQGFTYLLLLVALVIVGILSGVAATLTSTVVLAEKEQQLLFAGSAYSRAISNYYNAGSFAKEYPSHIEDLLLDPRFPLRRHLRKLYLEPFHPAGKWVIIRNNRGRIIGVSSSSLEEPLKQSNFPFGVEHFEGVNHYSEWRFISAEWKGSVAKRHAVN